jgi:hypothetical protein
MAINGPQQSQGLKVSFWGSSDRVPNQVPSRGGAPRSGGIHGVCWMGRLATDRRVPTQNWLDHLAVKPPYLAVKPMVKPGFPVNIPWNQSIYCDLWWPSWEEFPRCNTSDETETPMHSIHGWIPLEAFADTSLIAHLWGNECHRS